MTRCIRDIESGEAVRGRSVRSEEGKDQYLVIGVTSEQNQSRDIEVSASKPGGVVESESSRINGDPHDWRRPQRNELRNDD